jgi:alpha-glucosidase
LDVSIKQNPFSFKVSRKSTGEVLFDTSGHALIFESQYLGLRTSLPDSPNIYGLGESTDPFRLLTDDYTRTLWSRDAYLIPQFSNLYGNHPIYFDHRGPQGTHGVFLLNSNGMDIKIEASFMSIHSASISTPLSASKNVENWLFQYSCVFGANQSGKAVMPGQTTP